MTKLFHRLRRFSNREWRYAHRHDMPTRQGVLTVVLCLLLVPCGNYFWEVHEKERRIDDVIGAAERVIRCLNGKTTLGGEYTESDGSVWITTCQRVERRVR